MILIPPKIDYKGTITGLRISAVDGTAFIDNLPYTYQSDFSAGVDGWTATRGTVNGNIDSIGGADNWLRFTCDTSSGTHWVLEPTALVAGKKYKVTLKYYIPSGQTKIAGITIRDTSGNGVSANLLTLDAITTYSYDIVMTNTGLRIDATDSAGGITFQDAGGDDVFYIKDITISEITPYIDGNHSIEIYDPSNRMLKGVLKQIGTSEGLDTSIFATYNFTSGWINNGGGSPVDADTFSTVASGGIIKAAVTTNGRLYKSQLVTAANNANMQNNAGDFYYSNAGAVSYKTANSNSGVLLFAGAGQTVDVTTLSMQQVLTPSSTGCTIVSAKAGDTYNWTYKNSSFAYNQSSYFCIIKAIR